MEENKNMNNEVIENETEVVNTDELMVFTPDADSNEETNDNSTSNIAKVLMGLGAAGIGFGAYKLVTHFSKKPKEKSEDAPAEEKPKKEKKAKVQKVRGRKLTFHEIATGHLDLDPSEVVETEEEIETEE